MFMVYGIMLTTHDEDGESHPPLSCLCPSTIPGCGIVWKTHEQLYSLFFWVVDGVQLFGSLITW